jgi:hypothetical protein
MVPKSRTRKTPSRGAAPDLAPNPVTGGPADTGDAIFEERSESLAPPSLQTTGENQANPTPSATLAETAQFEDSAPPASMLSPVPDIESDKDSDIQHDNQANTTMHAAMLSGAILPVDSTSTASTPNPSEIDKDPEIQAALNRLQELEKQHRLLTIRQQIVRKERLVASIRLDADSLPNDIIDNEPDGTSADGTSASAPEPPSRSASKRTRSDTDADSYTNRPPPKRAVESRYQGRNMREFTTFIARMENHFFRYASYFTTDERKVAEGKGELSDTLLLKWTQHEKEKSGTVCTWKEFYDFLLHLINDPVNLLRQASQIYTDARQKAYQSVRDFATYLSQWEAQLPEPYTEKQRKEHLRTRVLESVRREALKYHTEPDSYDAFVAHLQTVEDSLPARRSEIKNVHRSKSLPHLSTTVQAASATNRTYERRCYHCGDTSHVFSKCPNKSARKKRPESKN